MTGQSRHPVAPGAGLEPHRRAVRLHPHSAKAHAELGLALQRAGQLAPAVASQRRALELDPGMVQLHAIMAPALHALAEFAAAAASYSQAIALQPDNPALHYGLGETLRAQAHYVLAAASYDRALQLRPQDPHAHTGLAGALHGLGQYDGALASYRRAIELAPDLIDAWLNCGNTFLDLGQFVNARDAYDEVLKLQPDHFGARFNLAASLDRQGRHDAALACFRRALEVRPGDLAAQRSISATLSALGRHEEALAYRQALRDADPDNGMLHFDVGQSLRHLGRNALAVESMRLALARLPNDASVHTYLGMLQMEAGERDLSLASNRRAYQLDPSAANCSNVLFILSHCTNDPDLLFAEHLHFAEQFERPLLAQRQPHPNSPDPRRRLNIGFVSADFYDHAIVTFIEPIFELLAHSEEVSLFAYSNGMIEDQVTTRLRGYIPNWRSIFAIGDDVAERQIRADAIDILIDMSGHSGGNRLPLFARKPAPVQASWLGYAGTTGLEAVDYYLSDGFHLPEGRYDDQFSEQIVRLPLGAPFMPSVHAPAISPLPALRNGYLTFGTFNRPNKLSSDVIALWAKLLHAIPDSRLVLGGLHPGADKLVTSWFTQQGISLSRVQLQPRGSMDAYLAAHDQIDICLAAFPYTGATTVGHALWMGVPTLTNTGPTNPSHAAVCFLAHLGLTSFVADNEAHFVDLGVFLSQNIPALAELRATMRERFDRSVVGHPIIAATGLERAMRVIWARWCQGLPPQATRIRLDELMTPEPEPEA